MLEQDAGQQALYAAALLEDLGGFLQAGLEGHPPAWISAAHQARGAEGYRDALVRRLANVHPEVVPPETLTLLQKGHPVLDRARAAVGVHGAVAEGRLKAAFGTGRLGLLPLSSDQKALFPLSDDAAGTYADLAHGFLRELDAMTGTLTNEGLLALLQRHVHAVPVGRVGVYDAARIRAAVAVCLHGAATASPPLLFVRGDLSGIQPFIFDVASRGAAKQLKARSFTVQLFTEVMLRHLTDRLGLKPAQVLYNGGGNFVLMVPNGVQDLLVQARETIERALLKEALYLSLAWTPAALSELEDTAGLWTRLFSVSEVQKKRRFQSLGAAAFKPFKMREARDMAEAFKQGTRQVFNRSRDEAQETGYQILPARRKPHGQDKALAWQYLFEDIGYQVQVLRTPNHPARSTATVINNADTFAGTWGGFRFMVHYLPRYDTDEVARWHDEKNTVRAGEDPPKPGDVLDFERLALRAKARTGTDKLGVLKMDVDDLGRLFANQTGKSLVDTSALSRSLQWFFEGYVNALLDETFTYMDADGKEQAAPFSGQLYPVFSGGDDFFIVGGWDAVFAFARRVHEAFLAFTGGTPTLSAGLIVVGAHFPVTRFAALAEHALDKAKAQPGKDRIRVMGETLTWAAFYQAQDLKDQLETLVKVHHQNRAVIAKVRRSAELYGALDGYVRQQGRVPVEWVWRFAYYLRSGLSKNKAEEVKHLTGQIVQRHTQVLTDALQAANPQAQAPDGQPSAGPAAEPGIFTVAARWAEFSTRNLSERTRPPSQPPNPATP